jgi:hypothetical protein
MSIVSGLRILVKLKARRLGQLEEALKRRRMHLQDQRCALDTCRNDESRCRADESARRARIADTTASGGFRGSEIVLLQHLVKEAAELTLAASARVRQAEQDVASAEDEVRAAERARRRGEQQLNRCQERLQAALDALARAEEDAQDEESEEVAVARLLAQARATG